MPQRKVRNTFEALQRWGGFPEPYLARAYARTGRRDEAVDILDKLLALEFVPRNLQSDPRFDDLVRRVGIPN